MYAVNFDKIKAKIHLVHKNRLTYTPYLQVALGWLEKFKLFMYPSSVS